MKTINIKAKIILIILISNNFAAGQTTQAISSQKDVTENRKELLRGIGQMYYEDGDLESALDAYKRILESNPEDKNAQYIISILYVGLKDYDNAIEHIENWIQENPEDFQGLNNLAWIYATAEDPSFRNSKKAVDLAQKALVLAPYDHHVWSTLAEAYYVAGDFERANDAILHLVDLATSGNAKMTKEMVDTYNEQIQKYSRALETKKLLQED